MARRTFLLRTSGYPNYRSDVADSEMQHFLSLPFFIPMYPTLSTTWSAFASSSPVTLFAVPTPAGLPIQSSFLSLPDVMSTVQGSLLHWRDLVVPSALAALLLNVITQGLCVRGVNRLTAVSLELLSTPLPNPAEPRQRVNSTTVNLVLTVRKAVSLGISVWYYGSGVNTGLAVGGAMVLCKLHRLSSVTIPPAYTSIAGTLIYSLAPGPTVADANKKSDQPVPASISNGPDGMTTSRSPSDHTELKRRQPATQLS